MASRESREGHIQSSVANTTIPEHPHSPDPQFSPKPESFLSVTSPTHTNRSNRSSISSHASKYAPLSAHGMPKTPRTPYTPISPTPTEATISSTASTSWKADSVLSPATVKASSPRLNNHHRFEEKSEHGAGTAYSSPSFVSDITLDPAPRAKVPKKAQGPRTLSAESQTGLVRPQVEQVRTTRQMMSQPAQEHEEKTAGCCGFWSALFGASKGAGGAKNMPTPREKGNPDVVRIEPVHWTEA
jgi:hypothetical protein